jgi:hypothetical protein
MDSAVNLIVCLFPTRLAQNRCDRNKPPLFNAIGVVCDEMYLYSSPVWDFTLPFTLEM